MTKWGSATEHQRTMRFIEDGRRRRRQCGGGCDARATHLGLANGVALMSGCEWHVRMWVKSPLNSLRCSLRSQGAFGKQPDSGAKCAKGQE